MNIFKVRCIFLLILLAICVCILIGRLFQIQILRGNEYAKRCRLQSKQRTLIAATRGFIRDRKGRILAKSIPSHLRIKTSLLANGDSCINNGNNNINDRYTTIKRLYPYGKLAGAVLGYIGTDGNGLAGAEYAFDKYLQGEDGWSIIQKDGRNHKYSRIGMPKKPPVNGSDIYLTIDVNLQKIVEKVLDWTVNKYHAKSSMCIIMDPVNGDILAMANEPGFNPNIWTLYSSEMRKNSCLCYNYEPGSTFKIVTAASVLQENLKDENDTIFGNNGKYEIYDQVIRDHKPFGNLTFSQALSYSSNVCFAKIANELGNDRFYKYIRDFGLGSPSGITLPGEESGIVHPVNRWSGRTRVTMAMGQEISVTLLQMMVVFSAIANEGILVEPRIYHKIINSKGKIIGKKSVKIKRRVISNNVALRLRRMMKDVVEYGTAKRCALPGMSIAGKTGTSQKIDKETGTYSKNRVWASFIGFAPVEKPALLCGIVIDEPGYGEVGGAVAGPAFRRIMQQIVSHPELEYAEKLIKSDIIDSNIENDEEEPSNSIKTIPDVCVMDRNQAVRFLSWKNIPFEIIGTGEQINYQSPIAGIKFTSDIKLILYTKDILEQSHDDKNSLCQVRVPNCVGKDLRDAVNAMNLKGLKLFVKGAGTVKKQEPSFGSMVQNTVTCTLFCSFEG